MFILLAILIFSPTFIRAQNDDLLDLGVPNYRCAPSLMAPSRVNPTNVNSVRPADIKLIMAIGDSHTAGNAAKATNALDLFQQYRGVSFTMGGDKSLEQHITIPNILRKYNPNLFGYSVGVGHRTNFSVSHLNLAWPGAHSYDLPDQAVDLVKILEKHVDKNSIQNDWKLLNLFIGTNDLCQYCSNPKKHTKDYFSNNIKKAIQTIKKSIPRVIVNLIVIFHLDLVRQVDATPICQGLHTFVCKCEFLHLTNEQLKQISILYQNEEKELEQSGIFDSNDFTLVVQPFFKDIEYAPRKADGSVELKFLAPDCFHFSQWGHADLASWAWKNMMEPVGRKTTRTVSGKAALPLACPDPACPFIRTVKNSQNCQKYFTPAA